MVRLKDQELTEQQIKFLCFNSNMVRLKVNNATVFAANIEKFQFQYGSIKRKRFGQESKFSLGFNSNMVRLKDKSNIIMNNTTNVSIPIWFD